MSFEVITPDLSGFQVVMPKIKRTYAHKDTIVTLSKTAMIFNKHAVSVLNKIRENRPYHKLLYDAKNKRIGINFVAGDGLETDSYLTRVQRNTSIHIPIRSLREQFNLKELDEKKYLPFEVVGTFVIINLEK